MGKVRPRSGRRRGLVERANAWREAEKYRNLQKRCVRGTAELRQRAREASDPL